MFHCLTFGLALNKRTLQKQTIYKDFTPFGSKQTIHIIDWDVNIWSSNILYIKL